MTEPVFTVDHLSYVPGERAVLADISFTVAAGEFVAVLGPNGAGKTTLFRHLNGILPSRGRIRVHGRPLESIPPRELARLLSYVPQAKGYIPPFRVVEFLLMSRYPHLSPFQTPGAADLARALAALERTGMAEFADRFLETLSGGERQLVFLAAAMVQETGVVLLDEPAGYLDPAHQVTISALLTQMSRQEGKTILMVTHDLNAALRLAGRILCLRDGRIFFHGDADRFMAERTPDALFGTSFRQYACSADPTAPPVWHPA